MDLSLYVFFSFIWSGFAFVLFKSTNTFCPTSVTIRIEHFFRSNLRTAWFVRYFMEANLQILIVVSLQLTEFRIVNSWGDVFSDAIALFFLLAIVFLMVFGSYKLRKMLRDDKLRDPANIKDYGEFYEPHIRDNPSTSQIFFNSFFMLRRLITVFCIFRMQSLPSLQIGIQIWMCLLWVGYAISERPFYNPILNKVEVLNNFFFWMILSFCFGLTAAVDYKSTRDIFGYIFIAQVIGLIIINVISILITPVQTVVLWAKRIFIHFKVKKAIRRRDDCTLNRPHRSLWHL